MQLLSKLSWATAFGFQEAQQYLHWHRYRITGTAKLKRSPRRLGVYLANTQGDLKLNLTHSVQAIKPAFNQQCWFSTNKIVLQMNAPV